MQQSCRQCGIAFEVSADDLAFYERVSPVIAGKRYDIPPPTHCPDCRCQRRLMWRNERTLYKRQCNFSGKQLLSMYSPNSSFHVYEHTIWYSDKWDPLQYGRPFNFNGSFFEQLAELLRAVPAPNLNLQAENENCEYTNFVSRNRNCYLIFAANDNEDCYYCTYMQRCRDVVDCFFVFDSEQCYTCIDCYRCQRLQWSQYCQDCCDSTLLYDCRGCDHCFGCVSLVQQKYHIFNEPHSRGEYEKKLQEVLSSRECFEAARAILADLKLQRPKRHYAGVGSESVTGDHISFSKNVHHCFDCTHLEDCSHCTWLHQGKDCMDHYAWGLPAELTYENHLCGNNATRVRFSDSCWNDVSDLLYCRYCVNGSSNLFGCIGLQRTSYCILNVQYTKKEYEELVPRIIKHMRQTPYPVSGPAMKSGSETPCTSWGEFFPSSLSPFAYNETVAQEYFPLGRDDAVQRGYRWKDDLPFTTGRETLSWSHIPWNIVDVPDTITQEVLACESCKKNFRIIPQELVFYRKMRLPLPRNCFDCRYRARRELRNPRKLWTRTCGKCQREIETSYAPDRPETVYCEECYLKEIY